MNGVNGAHFPAAAVTGGPMTAAIVCLPEAAYFPLEIDASYLAKFVFSLAIPAPAVQGGERQIPGLPLVGIACRFAFCRAGVHVWCGVGEMLYRNEKTPGQISGGCLDLVSCLFLICSCKNIDL